MNVFLGFKNGQLVTVSYSLFDDYENAVDVDYTIKNPQEAEKQVSTWKNEHP